MNVFDLDSRIVRDYERFARSFTEIRAEDIRQQIDAIYATGGFWPEPLISVNPHYERDVSVADLAREGSLHPHTSDVFRADSKPIVLYRHQAQAIAKATAGNSFVVTTGTGSGKSLCFFIPIIDAAIRARVERQLPRTRAIVVYPMNALANSQMQELRKFIEQSGLPEALTPTFARYTGQESPDERELIKRSKPDILLTNFMMLELLMTRQNERDQTVIANAEDLDFLVLDELHTYRGRQGADVAMLVRRVRDRLCRDRAPICIGTSATMASEGADEARSVVVSKVATRLFGVKVSPDSVIDESLERATNKNRKVIRHELARAVAEELPPVLTDQHLREHPLAIWIELEIGLKEGQRLVRRSPITIQECATKLADASGQDLARCRGQIESMLTIMSRPSSERGGSGDRAFLAFKLHRFISGAGFVYATLKGQGDRRVTLDGQRFDPNDPGSRLYPTFFCRTCGQEFHPVVLTDEDGAHVPDHVRSTRLHSTATIHPTRPAISCRSRIRTRSIGSLAKLEDFPDEWTEIGPGGSRRASFATSGACPTPNLCPTVGSDRRRRQKRAVSSREIQVLPELQGPAARSGARNQQARRLVRRGSQLCDHAAGFERSALDEPAVKPLPAGQAQAPGLHGQSPGRRTAGWPLQRFSLRLPLPCGYSGGRSQRRSGRPR